MNNYALGYKLGMTKKAADPRLVGAIAGGVCRSRWL